MKHVDYASYGYEANLAFLCVQDGYGCVKYFPVIMKVYGKP